MKRMALSALVTLCCSFGALVVAQDVKGNGRGPDVEDLNKQDGPPILGVHWARGLKPAQKGPAPRNPNMTYHGGKILTTMTTEAIWWGTSWAGSDVKITGMDTWFVGLSGSNYAKTVDEYTSTKGGVVQQVGSTGFNHQGHVIDLTKASGGSNTKTILNEVCKAVTSPDANGNGFYVVYSDVKRGGASYCAWHSAGSCPGSNGPVPVQFGFAFNLDGDWGCDPLPDPYPTVSTLDAVGHPEGLAALANITAHEQSEARSDPALNAWYDASGNENGDKCAWTFNAPATSTPTSTPGGYVTFVANSTQWILQGEWSNAAYTAGTGYPNSQGQKGCLDGQ